MTIGQPFIGDPWRSASGLQPSAIGRVGWSAAWNRLALKGDLDITRWLIWFLDCLDRAIDGAETILASVLHKARFWEVHSDAQLNDRQRDMVNRLLNGFYGKLTSSKWAKIEKCSQDTALRDIEGLLRLGALARDEGRGRSTSYSLVEPS